MIRRVAKSATVSETEQSEGLASVTRSAMVMIIIMIIIIIWIMVMIIIKINHSYDNLRHHNEFPDYDIFILSSLTVNVLANPPWVEILTQEGPF